MDLITTLVPVLADSLREGTFTYSLYLLCAWDWITRLFCCCTHVGVTTQASVNFTVCCPTTVCFALRLSSVYQCVWRNELLVLNLCFGPKAFCLQFFLSANFVRLDTLLSSPRPPVGSEKLTSRAKTSSFTSSSKLRCRSMRRGVTGAVRPQATNAVVMLAETRLCILASSKNVIHFWSALLACVK